MVHPRFSLIVPAYNEAAFLPRLLRSAHLARRRFRGGVNEIEIVVADNRSEDETAEIARRMGCRVATEEKRNIAAVRNAGAKAARGEVFVFTDADGWIHPETFNVIDAAVRSGRVVGGATGVRLERNSMGLAMTIAVAWPLLWLTKFDSGAVFCRREDFEAVGGYRESRAFAEDIAFLTDLAALGRR
ncbi:MAG: glycosyltransferase, partial [Thermodesulfobacteriota bacterium]